MTSNKSFYYENEKIMRGTIGKLVEINYFKKICCLNILIQQFSIIGSKGLLFKSTPLKDVF